MPARRLLLGRYEIGALIGEGAFARVYLAHDHMLDRQVAVKLLDAARATTADPRGHDRFMREARSSARFVHPRIVSTYDAGVDDDDLFIVMEYVEGCSLAQVIADEAPMSEHDIVRIATQLLDGLAAAHTSGLAHRDVKPANILIDPAGDVKLTDFGIAKRFDEITEALTVEGMVIGTRAYLAPERVRGEDGGPAADLYAVGAVLYEMATGQRPPPAEPSAPSVSLGPDPRLARPDLSHRLSDSIGTALAARADHRFSSAATMSAALSGLLDPTRLAFIEPTEALPPDQTPAATAPAVESATTAMLAGGTTPGGPTTAMPAAPTPPASRVGRSGRRWLVAIAVAVALAAGVAAYRSSDPSSATPNSGADPATSSTVSTAEEPTEPSSPPTSTPQATMQDLEIPPPAPAPPELIPGFPATDDVDEFIAQLRSGRVAGKQSKKLGDDMRKIVAAKDDDKRANSIDALFEKIDGWVANAELDTTVAQAAVEFLDEIEAAGGRADD